MFLSPPSLDRLRECCSTIVFLEYDLLVEPALTEGARPLAFNVGAYRHALVCTKLLYIVALLRNRHDTLSEDFTVYVRGRLMDFNQRELSHMVCAFAWLDAGHEETLGADALTFFRE